MQKITNIWEIQTVKNNIIIGNPIKMGRCIFEFHGTGNLLFIDDDVSMVDTSLRFLGDNSVVFLSCNRHTTRVKLDIYTSSVFYLGRDASTTRPIHVILSERRHLIIGDDCLFSRDVWFRNADPHLIYDTKSKIRNNPTKSIFLGDHVWVAQNVLVSKGTQVGSGSIIGGWSMTAGKLIESNTIWGGSPAKLIKTDIFWRKPSVHAYKKKQSAKTKRYDSDEFVFCDDQKQLSFSTIDTELNAIKSANDRCEYLYHNIYKNLQKNRFFMKGCKKTIFRTIRIKMKSLILDKRE